MLTKELEADAGKVVIGDTVKIGYYRQSGIVVKPGQKVIEVIKEFGEYIPLKKGQKLSASNLLERFMFDRKKQYDFVEKLSGGELKRLFLCTVLIQNPNFLILDEPTNDLDIMTLNVLENFLLDYPGNLIVVSHDRYFMDKIVDHLFVFRGNGVVEDFPGNYSDYRAYEDSSALKSAQKNIVKTVEVIKEVKPKENGLSHNERKDLNREFGRLEAEIERLNKKKKDLESKFANDEIASDKIVSSSEELQSFISDLETKEERWLEVSMLLE
jgi:ATP-binding cassette subfamily F protein uup